MASGARQHWLPRAYLRGFRSGDSDTVFMLDLFASPCWREVGLNEVCYSRRYHASPDVDRLLDAALLNGYPKLIEQIEAVDSTTSLDSILGPDEVDQLLTFVEVHLSRNALSSYRWGFTVLHEYIVEDPLAEIPTDVEAGAPRITREIEALRAACDQTGVNDPALRADLLMAWVHEKMEEDGPAHNFLRMPPAFDERLVEQLEGHRLQVFPERWILYSEDELFTMDNPFYLTGENETEGVMLALLTPHHLLICSDYRPPQDPDVGWFVKRMPWFTFSTKLFSNRPRDVQFTWGHRPPRAVDPEGTARELELGELADQRWSSIPVVYKAGPRGSA